MHESYDDDNDDYYGDNYDDSQEYNKSQPDWTKFYFKFDVSSSPISDWVQKFLDDLNKDISEFKPISFPVSSYFSNTANGGNSILYLGNNYQNQPIWKTKYFIEDKVAIAYKNHIQNHAEHFVTQPIYYKGLFDILN
jgi:hypothetical protein